MIILYSSDQNLDYSRYLIYPDQFVSEKKKQTPDYIKHTVDYFANIAFNRYKKNNDDFVDNYKLVKGILTPQDFYQDEDIKSFTDTMMKSMDLPKYVKNYSIVTTPLNMMVGEMSSRPDFSKVKAFDDDSKNEQLEAMTEYFNQMVLSLAKEKILNKSDVELSDEELSAAVSDRVKDYLVNYTTEAEMWANKVLEAMKMEFNMKELSEEGFRDLLISAREFFHIYPNSSKLGFGVEEVNPKNVWALTLPDRKYLSSPRGIVEGAYACGIIRVMEFSEILERFELDIEEINHLRDSISELTLYGPRESNFAHPSQSGIDTIKYDTISPLVAQERLLLESELKGNEDDLSSWLGLTQDITSFANKFVVVECYFLSKKKIGKVMYKDEFGDIQSSIVDENYERIPNQVGEVDWSYDNQWYRALKIGPHIYKMEPYDMLPYCPLIGVVFERKNADAKSLIDMMKPLQVLYNVCMNQLFELLKKEKGNLGVVSLRRIPVLKDADHQDALDQWEAEARASGIMFDDDSPENTKGAISNTTIAKNIDLTRTQEIQSRYTLAQILKNECWELVGISRERLGKNQGATQTATSIQNAMSQSYAQTEPWFVQHEYVMRQVYQAIIDAAQYIECNKPYSTLSYINNEADPVFFRIQGNELKLKDLRVYVTSRREDQKAFEELRGLAQEMLQNGASPYEITELFSTNSIRQMKHVMKRLKEEQTEFQKRQQEIEQQALQQKQQEANAKLEFEASEREKDRINENYNKELDRINKKEVALIAQLGRNANATQDLDNSGLADALEITQTVANQEAMHKDHEIKLKQLQEERRANEDKRQIELEKLKVERENMQNDLAIEKLRAKSKSKENKSKPKK